MSLSKYQKDLINQSVKSEDVLANLDALNEEIGETYKDLVNTEVEEEATLEVEDVDSALEKELASLMSKLETRPKKEEVKVEVQPEEEEMSPQEKQKEAIFAALAKRENAPNKQDIENFKKKYGKNGVNVLALGDDDIYIFTYIRRGQFEKISELVEQQSKGEANINLDKLMKEKIVQYSVLWPKVGSVEFLYNSRAGVIDTLYQTIMLNSYFLSPQQAMMFTTQL